MKKSMFLLAGLLSMSLYGGLDVLEEKEGLVGGPPSGLAVPCDTSQPKEDNDKNETKPSEELTFCGVCTALLCFLTSVANDRH